MDRSAACAAIAPPPRPTRCRPRRGNAYLVRDRATADGGRAVVFTDITDKTRAENALALAQSRAGKHPRRALAGRPAISPISPGGWITPAPAGRQRQDHAAAHHEP